MIIGVPREVVPGERRIALVPDSVRRLVEKGYEVYVEGAGDAGAAFADSAYDAVGAKLVGDASVVWRESTVVVKVQPPTPEELEKTREEQGLISVLRPFDHLDVVRGLAERRVTAFAMDLMPRITRAQSMDVLSSQATVAGYKAILLAASDLPTLMPMLMTAAGTLKPARVLVLGAGVAGLQAIATARRLGAVVEAFDIRAAVKEQVESLGARFVAHETVGSDAEDERGYARELSADEQARQREVLSEHMADADVIVCTALVPGRRAPVLMTRADVERMRPGSLVVDLAAESGGNCELTRAGEVVDSGGVRIHGPINLPSTVPVHASQMLSRNNENYLMHLLHEGELRLDFDDELTTDPLVTYDGEIVNERVRNSLGD